MKKGFTLIELAIVVVVLGILITGIVGGRSLMRAAEQRAVINNFTKYSTMINAFRLEYDSLPGDFDEGYDYWGGQTQCTSDSDVNDTNSSNSCNGNGDKKIGWLAEGKLLAWKHLKLSKIDSVSNDVSGSSVGNNWVAGQTVPKAKGFDDVCVYLRYMPNYTTGGRDISNNYNHIHLGKDNGHSSAYCGGGFLEPAQAYSIDKKIDDGTSLSGNLKVTQHHKIIASSDRRRCSKFGKGISSYFIDHKEETCALGFAFD